LTGLPILFSVYLCQFNVLAVYSQLKEPTDENIHSVVYSALAVITVIYCCLGFIGCLLFGEYNINELTTALQEVHIRSLRRENYPDNVLELFDTSDPLILISRIAMFISLLCTIPMIIIPARSIIIKDILGFSGCNSV